MLFLIKKNLSYCCQGYRCLHMWLIIFRYGKILFTFSNLYHVYLHTLLFFFFYLSSLLLIIYVQWVPLKFCCHLALKDCSTITEKTDLFKYHRNSEYEFTGPILFSKFFFFFNVAFCNYPIWNVAYLCRCKKWAFFTQEDLSHNWHSQKRSKSACLFGRDFLPNYRHEQALSF